jgi:hypothetical protein
LMMRRPTRVAALWLLEAADMEVVCADDVTADGKRLTPKQELRNYRR